MALIPQGQQTPRNSRILEGPLQLPVARKHRGSDSTCPARPRFLLFRGAGVLAPQRQVYRPCYEKGKRGRTFRCGPSSRASCNTLDPFRHSRSESHSFLSTLFKGNPIGYNSESSPTSILQSTVSEAPESGKYSVNGILSVSCTDPKRLQVRTERDSSNRAEELARAKNVSIMIFFLSGSEDRPEEG